MGRLNSNTTSLFDTTTIRYEKEEEKTKADVTREIIREAQQKYGIKKFVGLFSGGKDSLVTCHFLHKLGVMDEVLYCNTGVNLPENLFYVINTCKQFGWKLNMVQPKENETYEDFVRKFRFPHAGAHSMIMGYLKWHPMRTWARQHRDEQFAFCSGRRFKESKRRSKILGKTTIIEQTEKMTFVAPLYYWTDEDVWNYIKENSLTRCPVYETLHISGDCLCGAFAEPEEIHLIKIFHPEFHDWLLSLEEKYGDRWGNGMSARASKTQQELSESLVCQECRYGG